MQDADLNEMDRDDRDGSVEDIDVAPSPEDVEARDLAKRVGLASGLAAALWFVWIARPGVGVAPWLGLVLSGEYPYQLPFVWRVLADWVVAIPVFSAAWKLNVVSAVTMGAACGLLAAIVAAQTRRFESKSLSKIAGLTAALLFALSPTVIAIGAEAHPAGLTLALCLGAMYTTQSAMMTQRLRWHLASGLLAGLAAANHPAFAWAFLPLFIASVKRGTRRRTMLLAIAVLLAGFGLTMSLPITAAWLGIGHAHDFLTYAMYAPYPYMGAEWLNLDFGRALLDHVPLGLVIAAAVGLIALFDRNAREGTLWWAALFLLLGPFLPIVTNQARGVLFVVDEEAPWVLVIAAFSAFAAFGVAGLHEWLAQRLQVKRVTPALIGLWVALVIGVQAWTGLLFRPASPELLARAILEACPEDAILASGDLRATALLRAVQHLDTFRADVTVLPAELLAQTGARHTAITRRTDTIVGATFPPADAWTRWPLERPREFAALKTDDEQMPRSLRTGVLDLALWELARDNFTRRPMCFVALSPSWLTARARRNGVVLQFPTVQTKSGDTEKSLRVAMEMESGDARMNTLRSALLIPASEAMRKQGETVTATQLSALLRELDADNPLVWLISARSAARQGMREAAMQHLYHYLDLEPTSGQADRLLALVDDEMRRDAATRKFDETFDAQQTAGDLPQYLLQEFWDLDELSALRAAYQSEQVRDSLNAEQRYDYAAVLAQLGELEAARSELSAAVKLDLEAIAPRLDFDGRFSLLRVEGAHKPI